MVSAGEKQTRARPQAITETRLLSTALRIDSSCLSVGKTFRSPSAFWQKKKNPACHPCQDLEADWKENTAPSIL